MREFRAPPAMQMPVATGFQRVSRRNKAYEQFKVFDPPSTRPRCFVRGKRVGRQSDPRVPS